VKLEAGGSNLELWLFLGLRGSSWPEEEGIEGVRRREWEVLRGELAGSTSQATLSSIGYMSPG
jgi:hypothetical protein